MNNVDTNDLKKLWEAVIKESNNGELSTIIVGDYDTIVDAFNYLLKNTKSNFVSGELLWPEFSDYDGPHYLQFDEHEIWCGNALNKDRDFLWFEEDLAFIDMKYVKQYISTNGEDGVIVFGSIDDHETCDDHSECLTMDDDNYGFTYCSCVDGNVNKFRYRGTCKLTENMAKSIIKYNTF